MAEIGDFNARLRAIGGEAKSIILKAVRGEREPTEAEAERLRQLQREKAQIERESR